MQKNTICSFLVAACTLCACVCGWNLIWQNSTLGLHYNWMWEHRDGAIPSITPVLDALFLPSSILHVHFVRCEDLLLLMFVLCLGPLESQTPNNRREQWLCGSIFKYINIHLFCRWQICWCFSCSRSFSFSVSLSFFRSLSHHLILRVRLLKRSVWWYMDATKSKLSAVNNKEAKKYQFRF